MNAKELRIELKHIEEAVRQHNEVEIIGPLMARKHVITELLEKEEFLKEPA